MMQWHVVFLGLLVGCFSAGCDGTDGVADAGPTGDGDGAPDGGDGDGDGDAGDGDGDGDVECPAPLERETVCDNSCATPSDGHCDEDYDEEFEIPASCEYGTDCDDCGPIPVPLVCTPGFTLTGNETVDLSAFNCIDGNVRVEDTTLTDLSMFETITAIHGHLVVINNVQLTSLDGLERVHDIGVDLAGDVRLQDNPLLHNLCGLNGFTGSYGRIVLSGLDAITTLNAFQSVDGIAGFEISNNASLEKIELFAPGLPAIDGPVTIRDNPMLHDLSGFPTAEACDDFELSNNDSLENLNGLGHLFWVGGPFMVSDNDALESFAGFEILEFLEGDAFTVTDNPLLPTSEVDDLLEAFQANGFEGSVTIEGNG